MKKQISQKQKIFRMLSALTFLLGSMLLVYMIAEEDEPGALLLLLIILGLIAFFYNRYQIKEELREG